VGVPFGAELAAEESWNPQVCGSFFVAAPRNGAIAKGVQEKMLTYLYVALGGAIGSVARAWTTNLMVGLAGPQFPWGTILINIVGSFIIGFFGALTSGDGRFQVPGEARAFVMVGICGGYTTFSSFSLQTLDLLRDGKLGGAFVNVALSLILCLAAVTAGYASAAELNAAPARRLAAAKNRSLGEVVLAVLDRPEAVSSVLSSAARLLAYGKGGRIEALAVRTPPVAALMVADQALTPADEMRLRDQEQDWANEMRTLVERWESPASPASIVADFTGVEGEVAHFVAERGRRSDMIVVSCETRGNARAREATHAAIFDTSRAVLIVPPNSVGSFGQVVAVAWKDDIRAPKAVLAALPILEKAEAVHVLRARTNEAVVPPILEEHGVSALVHAVDSGDPVGAQLLRAAHELGADMIVMGAYAHGEWREALLGGVTRYMLDHADLPLLMRH
jgi:protein CrcB